MKSVATMLIFLFALVMVAQEQKPVFEKNGDMVKATYFHENGTLSQTGSFLEGKLHGEWIMYDEEGNKLVVGQYDQGRKVGTWLYWEDEMLKEVDYSDNKIAAVGKLKEAETVVKNR